MNKKQIITILFRGLLWKIIIAENSDIGLITNTTETNTKSLKFCFSSNAVIGKEFENELLKGKISKSNSNAQISRLFSR